MVHKIIIDNPDVSAEVLSDSESDTAIVASKNAWKLRSPRMILDSIDAWRNVSNDYIESDLQTDIQGLPIRRLGREAFKKYIRE